MRLIQGKTEGWIISRLNKTATWNHCYSNHLHTSVAVKTDLSNLDSLTRQASGTCGFKDSSRFKSYPGTYHQILRPLHLLMQEQDSFQHAHQISQPRKRRIIITTLYGIMINRILLNMYLTTSKIMIL